MTPAPNWLEILHINSFQCEEYSAHGPNFRKRRERNFFSKLFLKLFFNFKLWTHVEPYNYRSIFIFVFFDGTILRGKMQWVLSSHRERLYHRKTKQIGLGWNTRIFTRFHAYFAMLSKAVYRFTTFTQSEILYGFYNFSCKARLQPICPIVDDGIPVRRAECIPCMYNISSGALEN